MLKKVMASQSPNPIKKIYFECDLSKTEVNYFLVSDLRLDIGVWQIAIDSVSFFELQEWHPFTNFNFKISSDLVTEYVRDGGKYMLNYTSLGRFCYSGSSEAMLLKEFPYPKWFMVNNYQSENISFFLNLWPQTIGEPAKKNSFPPKKVKVLIEVLLQKISS